MRTIMAALVAATVVFPAAAQIPAPTEPKADDAKATAAPAAPADASLAQLGWLEGCWKGSVNKREFREHWLPLRGALLIGASHTVMDGKTQDYEFLRIEPRADGIYYVTIQPGQADAAFKLVDTSTDKDTSDTMWSFQSTGSGFPQFIRYRRGAEGWLYAHVEGTVEGVERKVIYPMRRVDCQTGEFIRK